MNYLCKMKKLFLLFIGLIFSNWIIAQKQIEIEAIEINRSKHLLKTNKFIKQEQLIQNQGKTIAEILGLINGISLLKSGTNISKPIFNGLYGQRILLINDGVRHESQQWGAEHADEIDPFTVQDISIVKGSDILRYGSSAIGGVIQLNAKNIDYERTIKGSIQMALNSNGRGASLYSRLEGAVNNKFSYRLGFTAKKYGNIKTAEYYLGNTGSEELNGNILLNLKGNTNNTQLAYSQFNSVLGVFEGAHIGSVEDILARIERGKPFEKYHFSYKINAPNQQVKHQVVKLQHVYKIDTISSFEAQYSLQHNQRREYDLRRVLENKIPMANLTLTTQSIDFIYQRFQTKIGISGKLQVNNNIPGTGTTPIIPNFDNHNLAAFITQKINLGVHELDLGLRYDYTYFDVSGYKYDYINPNTDGTFNLNLFKDRKYFNSLSGIVGFTKALNPSTVYNSNISLAWRPPSANELYSDGIHHGAGVYELGNNRLRAEYGTKWSNTFTYTNRSFQLQWNVFANYIANYIYNEPNPDSIRQTIRGTFPIFEYKQSDAIFYGTDIQMQIYLSKNSLYEIGASVVRANNLSKKGYFPYIPADNFKHAVRQNVKINKATGLYIRLENTIQTQQKRYTEGTDFVAPPPAYWLFNLATGTYFKGKKINNTNLHITIDNLFNVAYKDYLDRFRYYSHATGRNISVKINHTF